MSEVAALPSAAPAAEASEQQQAEPGQQQAAEAQNDEGAEAEQPAKPAKTPEQRALDRADRKIDRLYRQREEARAEVAQLKGGRLPAARPDADNQGTEGEGETLTLSRTELQALVRREAEQLAPTIKEQQTEMERRNGVVDGLTKEWGTEKFNALAKDLQEAFDGLVDRSGKPKPATDAIFESDDPKSLIEYLADPENADEAEALGRMGDRQAGRAIAKLEQKVAALKAQAKTAGKAQPSKVPPPIEIGRGSGASNSAPDPSKHPEAWVAWRNKQINQR